MDTKKIAVVAGTPVDTKMGVDFLKNKGLDVYSYPVSPDAKKQLLFQTMPIEDRKQELIKLINNIKNDGMSAIFVYCNSLSASIDFGELSKITNIYIVTPLDVYKILADNYNYLGLICANNQATGGIEKIIVNKNSKCKVVGLGMMQLVYDIEDDIPAEKILKNNNLKGLIKFYESINIDALILGCTHFPYFENELKAITSLTIINPAEKMYELLCQNI